MTETTFKPTIGDQELTLVCVRIEQIFARVRKLQADRADPDFKLRAIPIEEIMAQPLRSRLEAVDSDIRGLEYAVWCIGETLLATAGRDAMDYLMGMLEDREDGTRLASWLDHRWDGVTDGRATWTA